MIKNAVQARSGSTSLADSTPKRKIGRRKKEKGSRRWTKVERRAEADIWVSLEEERNLEKMEILTESKFSPILID